MSEAPTPDHGSPNGLTALRAQHIDAVPTTASAVNEAESTDVAKKPLVSTEQRLMASTAINAGSLLSALATNRPKVGHGHRVKFLLPANSA